MPRLSQFILANIELILQRWEDFARSLEPGGPMTIEALRNDAEGMLRFIAADIETEQSSVQEFHKSRGLGPQLPGDEQSAAHAHGLARATKGFSLMELVSEYRALRASVTRMWLDAVPATHENVIQLGRFNEAVDQILAEAVARFSAKLDRDADLFTASVGHDLSNPLNAVILSAHTLTMSSALGDREQKTAARIERSAVRIAEMLNDLKDFTRTRLGSIIGYEREPFRVGDLCREVIEEFQATYPTRTIAFTESGDTTAFVDTKRVRQLLSNLVANAIQHGSVEGLVTVRAVCEDAHIRVEVHNEGPIIEPYELEKIFDPLHRGGKTRAAGDAGNLGLGLYIARRIAVAHGGSLEARSTEANGTTLVAYLPRHGEH
jgi:signal transduction histidine kinase